MKKEEILNANLVIRNTEQNTKLKSISKQFMKALKPLNVNFVEKRFRIHMDWRGT